MSAQITIISEDFSHGRSEWRFNGVYRIGSDHVVRVHIEKDFYDFQSHAKIEAWRAEGWRFFTSLPVEEWYELLPSTSKKSLGAGDREQFLFLAGELLERYCDAMWNTTDGITLHPSKRRSDYREAQDDGAIAVGGFATP